MTEFSVKRRRKSDRVILKSPYHLTFEVSVTCVPIFTAFLYMMAWKEISENPINQPNLCSKPKKQLFFFKNNVTTQSEHVIMRYSKNNNFLYIKETYYFETCSDLFP